MWVAGDGSLAVTDEARVEDAVTTRAIDPRDVDPRANNAIMTARARGKSPTRLLALYAFISLTLFVAVHAEPPPAPAYSPGAQDGPRYKAVLIAGDQSAAAFDHATQAVRDRLLAAHVPPADIQRFTASRAIAARGDARASRLDTVLAAIERLHPGPGEGCFVFATSHGAYQEGFVLMPSENYLTLAALDKALTRGCGDAPTVVVISSCFSGSFAKPPMARPNRVILTAARDDRPSFGCGAGFQYTVHDRCLLQAMDAATVWRAAYAMIQACVSAREKSFGYPPSEPQAWFGDAVSGLRVPRR